jgi:hypothetical protein
MERHEMHPLKKKNLTTDGDVPVQDINVSNAYDNPSKNSSTETSPKVLCWVSRADEGFQVKVLYSDCSILLRSSSFRLLICLAGRHRHCKLLSANFCAAFTVHCIET